MVVLVLYYRISRTFVGVNGKVSSRLSGSLNWWCPSILGDQAADMRHGRWWSRCGWVLGGGGNWSWGRGYIGCCWGCEPLSIVQLIVVPIQLMSFFICERRRFLRCDFGLSALLMTWFVWETLHVCPYNCISVHEFENFRRGTHNIIIIVQTQRETQRKPVLKGKENDPIRTE